MTDGGQPYTKAERLLNLLMALRGTRSGLTREQIRAVVRGYREDASERAFERMFERDKDQLRSMGIPLITLTDASGAVTGYRIDRHWNLPPMDLDRSELAVLGLAARAWRLADMGPAALNALRKVEAQLGMESDPAGGAPVVGLTADSPELLALIDACTTRTPVTFQYRRGSSVEAQRRHVQPWGVVWWRAHWYVVGWDADRCAVRVFRASRIAGEVRAAGDPGDYEVPEGFDPTAAIGRFPADGGTRLTLALTSGAGAALRRDGRDLGPDDAGADQVEVYVEDIPSGVARALSHGGNIQVRGPSAAVAEAIRQLGAIVEAHRTAPPPTGRPTPLGGRPAPGLVQFSRLLALVPWLAANSGVSVRGAADHFGISEEQLLADLGSVITSGADDWTLFDIQYWENGGVIEVIDALDLGRPLTLTPDEGVAVLVALHALRAVPGGHDRGVLDSVIRKLRQALGDQAPAPEAVAVRVDLPVDVVQPIEAALAGGKAMELTYLGAVRDEITERTVDPVALVVVDGYAYLRAHCRRAGSLRLFRLDRILAARMSSEPARPVDSRSDSSVAPMAAVLAATGRSVVVDLSPEGRHLLDRHPTTRAWSLPDGWVRAEMPVGEYEWARRLVLGSAGAAVLREPIWLAEDVLDAARTSRLVHVGQVASSTRA